MKVFIVHGWTYSLDKWTELISILDKAGIETEQLRVPGLTSPSSKVWTIGEYVEWLKQQLEGEVKPVVIGHSNGGRIALAFASKYPDALSKLILVDSAGVYHGDILSKTKRAGFKTAAKIGKPLSKIPIAKKVFYRLIGAKDYYKAPANMKKTMRNMLAADRKLNLKNVKIPIQLIWGSNDSATPLSDGRKLQKALNAPLEIIAGAGHSPHASHPHKVAEIIIKSVGEL